MDEKCDRMKEICLYYEDPIERARRYWIRKREKELAEKAGLSLSAWRMKVDHAFYDNLGE